MALLAVTVIGMAFLASRRALRERGWAGTDVWARQIATNVERVRAERLAEMEVLTRTSDAAVLAEAYGSKDPERWASAISNSGTRLASAWHGAAAVRSPVELRTGSGSLMYRTAAIDVRPDPSVELSVSWEAGLVSTRVLVADLVSVDALSALRAGQGTFWLFGASGSDEVARIGVAEDGGDGTSKGQIVREGLASALPDVTEAGRPTRMLVGSAVASVVRLESVPWSVAVTLPVRAVGSPLNGLLGIQVTLALLALGSAVVATRTVERRRVRAVEGGDPRLEWMLSWLMGERPDVAAKAEEVPAAPSSTEASFAATLSHEIRNPLTSLKMNLQGLERARERGTIPDVVRRPVEICLHEIDRLDGLVRDALSLAKSGAEERQPVKLNGLIESAAATLRTQFDRAGVLLILRLDARDPEVVAPATATEGVFLNLLLNALDHSERGGTVTLTGDQSAGPPQRVTVAVADEGPGVREDDHDKIFTPFFSTRPGGTGLGLAIARRTARDSGGDLQLEPSAPREGARFVLDLPLNTRTAPR